MPDTDADRDPLARTKISMGIRMSGRRTSHFGWNGTSVMGAMLLLLLVNGSTAAGASAGAVGL